MPSVLFPSLFGVHFKEKKEHPFNPIFLLFPWYHTHWVSQGKKKKREKKIGVGLGKALGCGLYPTFPLTMRRGSLLQGPPTVLVLHCIKEQKTQIKTRGKQQAQAHCCYFCCSFQSISYNTGIYLFGFYRENRFAVGRQCTIVPSHLIDIN